MIDNKVLIIGSKQIGLSLLKHASKVASAKIVGILTIDDSKDARSELNEIKNYCTQNNIPLFFAANRTDSEKIISDVKPDICFVAGWYYILSEKILRSVPNGFIGIHHSLLPKYRGGSPLVWSIINGDEFTGTSIFKFSSGMDDGPVYAQKKIEITNTDYIADVLDKCNNAAIEMLAKNFAAIVDGSLKAKEQNLKESTFCALRMPDDGLINWNWQAEKIYNFIRAQASPYPCAFTFFESEKLGISKAEVLNDIFYGTPGQVINSGANGVSVVCGDNKILILKEVSYRGDASNANQVIKSITTRLK
ncbi:MAG TPA: methionyl-tRNA formyltransferase [Bacteroidia bacterium]|nr:methionyl-tRNA formyltransferase [Bacteroidia bacterium]HNU33596.1 methionyl-tRNA formyltransferase [Bacteroidia bacterium]